MFHILAINRFHRIPSLYKNIHEDNRRFWSDLLVREEDEERFLKELRAIYGNSLRKEVFKIGFGQKRICLTDNLGRDKYPFINIFFLTSKNEHLFRKYLSFTIEFQTGSISDLESFNEGSGRRCIPFEYSWARSRASYSKDCFKYLTLIKEYTNYLDNTDLEEDFTKTQPFRDSYSPISYDWGVLNNIRAYMGLKTELFDTPFIVSRKGRPNQSILEDISKEMLVRTIYLMGNKLTKPFSEAISFQPWISTYDFLRRIGVSDVSDLVKRNFSTVLSKINNESINNILKSEKIYLTKGKRTTANWY